MTTQSGTLVLIKVGDGGDPELFTTIGGLQASKMVIDNQLLETTNAETGAWRQLLGNAGIHFLSIEGSGLFTDSVSEEMVRSHAFSGGANSYQFIFANGNKVSGQFIITTYERSGNYGGGEIYALTLESAGTITFTVS